MLVREEHIPINPFTRPGTKRSFTRNVVVHYTGNPGASAANHVSYFGRVLLNQDPTDNKPDTYASAHIFIDKKEAILLIPLDELAYHASQANPYSIGVELCIESDGSFHPDTVDRAVKVVAYLCQKYELNPARDLLRHYDVTGKICPKPFVDKPYLWEAFKAKVAKVAKVEEGGKPMQLTSDQWKSLAHALDELYHKSTGGALPAWVVADYTWVEKCYTEQLTGDEAAYLLLTMFARSQGVTV